jgi:SAM-dependent methyltransferase
MASPESPVTRALPTGASTMSPAMAGMQAYPQYLYDKVAPSLGSRVWEIGVGHGTYTQWLYDAGKAVLATDIDPDCLGRCAKRFAGDSRVVTARVDLTDVSTLLPLREFRADSILCFNVLEHIEDDMRALAGMRETAAPSAALGLIVPAHPALYGRMDAEAGHFRRYTRRSLRDTLERSGWQVQTLRYINLTGALGWWYHNRWRKSAGLADESVNRQMRGVDRWLPRLARLTDPVCGRLAGLSVLAIARSPAKEPP